jgi:hypothetical protein
VDLTAAEPTRTPTVGLVAQPKLEAGRAEPDSGADATGALGRGAAGYPLIAVLVAVQAAWLLALGYLIVRLLT